MAKIRWTSEAETWLKDIHDYIAEDNPAAARSVVKGIYDKVQLLKDYARVGYVYRTDLQGEIRILLYGHYRVAYLVKVDESIDILGVFHGALDIERYLL